MKRSFSHFIRSLHNFKVHVLNFTILHIYLLEKKTGLLLNVKNEQKQKILTKLGDLKLKFKVYLYGCFYVCVYD